MNRDIQFILLVFISLAIAAIPYMAFPIIKLILNHGRFAKTQAKQIALWNSVTLGAFSLWLVISAEGVWSIVPPFVFYWINRAILTDKNKKDDEDSTKNGVSLQGQAQRYKCADCGRMGPYDGDCPDCGSGEIVFLDPETVQAREDDIDTACKPTPKETAVDDMQPEKCDTSPDIPAPTKTKIDILPYVTGSVFNPAMRVDTPKESDTSTDITDTSDSTVNASEPIVSKSNVKESNNHSKPRYCSRCGQLIDPETKRCTGCGRRRFPIKPILISLSAVLLLVGVVGVGYHFALPEIRYRKATSYIEQGDYSKANAVLEEIIDYKNSRELMHKHSYTEIVSQVDATCDTDGYIIKRCICGKEEKEVLKAAHLYSKATCTEPEKCTRCGAIGSEALGHDDSGAFCSRCGEKLFETQEYSGVGPGNITGINLPHGGYNITFTHDGNSNFVVEGSLYDRIWVNEIGKTSYVCQIALLLGCIEGYLNITCADGAWTVTIEAIQ